jgi:hypothetical protein
VTRRRKRQLWIPSEASLIFPRKVRKSHETGRAAARTTPLSVASGILFWDITTILLNPSAFKFCIELFVDRYKNMKVDVVAGGNVSVCACGKRACSSTRRHAESTEYILI